MPQSDTQTEADIRRTAETHLRAALAVLGMDPAADAHLAKTPENVTDFLLEFLAPFVARSAPPAVSTFPAEEMTGQIVMIKDLSYHSLCAHHLTPFFGTAHIAYVPAETGIGIGAPAKVLDHFARRPQLQERLAAQVADALMHACAPRGVMVWLTARQMCMEMRGERAEGIIECSAVRGCFADESWQRVFFSRIRA